jgi:hypothetical protein
VFRGDEGSNRKKWVVITAVVLSLAGRGGDAFTCVVMLKLSGSELPGWRAHLTVLVALTRPVVLLSAESKHSSTSRLLLRSSVVSPVAPLDRNRKAAILADRDVPSRSAVAGPRAML